jgi:hypothetical protein
VATKDSIEPAASVFHFTLSLIATNCHSGSALSSPDGFTWQLPHTINSLVPEVWVCSQGPTFVSKCCVLSLHGLDWIQALGMGVSASGQ